jgi:predicted permease
VIEDVVYAARRLSHARAFTAVAVVTLALGIAGTTMFFAAVNAMVFRPIRATHTDGLYAIRYIHKLKSSGPLTEAQFKRLDDDPPASIGRIGAISGLAVPVVVSMPGRAERVDAEVVTPGYLLALDLSPQAGRLLAPEDDRLDTNGVVIISDRLWRQWFAGDHAVIGRTLAVNARSFMIAGVAPRGFRGLAGSSYGTADVWMTRSAAARAGSQLRSGGYLMTFVRPRAGVSAAAAEAAIHSVLSGAPDDPPADQTAIRLVPIDDWLDRGTLTSAGLAIVGLSTLLLIAACANLANMLFARGAQRAGEVAVRISLGAGRLSIFRLFAIESALISALAASLGLLLAIGAVTAVGYAFPWFRSRNMRILVDLAPDYRVFLFAFAAGAAAALVVGLAAAWRAVSGVPLRGLSSAASIGSGRRAGGLRFGLVGVQVAAAVVLLMTAGLFLRATEKGLDREVLFDIAPLATARVDLRMHGYHEAAGRVFFERALLAARALPGVESAALADGFPAGDYAAPFSVDFRAERSVVDADGIIREIPGIDRVVRGGYVGVSPGFLTTIGLPLRRGRDVTISDRDTAPAVAVISESVARQLWPGQDAIGRRLMFGNDGTWRTVVGVFGDPVSARLESPLVGPANLVLVPAAQAYRPEMLLVIRASRPAAQIEPLRAAIRGVDEQVAVFDTATAEESIMASAAPLSAAGAMTSALGLLALTIAALGLYGVVSYVVALRSREFGIRMALGAQPKQVLRMVLDEAVRLVLAGLLAGVFITSIGERYLQSQRVGFMPNEIATWVAVLLLIVVVGVVAALRPALRAAQVDPNVALREL